MLAEPVPLMPGTGSAGMTILEKGFFQSDKAGIICDIK